MANVVDLYAMSNGERSAYIRAEIKELRERLDRLERMEKKCSEIRNREAKRTAEKN